MGHQDSRMVVIYVTGELHIDSIVIEDTPCYAIRFPVSAQMNIINHDAELTPDDVEHIEQLISDSGKENRDA